MPSNPEVAWGVLVRPFVGLTQSSIVKLLVTLANFPTPMSTPSFTPSNWSAKPGPTWAEELRLPAKRVAAPSERVRERRVVKANFTETNVFIVRNYFQSNQT